MRSTPPTAQAIIPRARRQRAAEQFGEQNLVADTPVTDVNPADLVARIGCGDPRAERDLVARYQRGIRFLLLSKTHGDLQLAEDLCQETLITVIQRLRKQPIDEPQNLAAYIRGIATRLYIGDLRKNIRRNTRADSEAIEIAPDHGPGQAEILSREVSRRLVRQLIDEMTVPRDRQLLLRVYVLDEDKKTVCRALRLDSVHYNRVLSRAKKRFRRLVEDSSRRAQISAV